MPRFFKTRPVSCNSSGIRAGKFPFFPLTEFTVDDNFVSFCRERIRYQRRAKLKFGTKLGMNSPF